MLIIQEPAPKDTDKISKKKAREAIDYLLKYKLVIKGESGNLKVGPTLLHLDSQSPHTPRHHQNWRIRAFNHYENIKPNDLFYSVVLTLSKDDVSKLREKTLQFIREINSTVKDSPSEELYCFCMDWFEI